MGSACQVCVNAPSDPLVYAAAAAIASTCPGSQDNRFPTVRQPVQHASNGPPHVCMQYAGKTQIAIQRYYAHGVPCTTTAPSGQTSLPTLSSAPQPKHPPTRTHSILHSCCCSCFRCGASAAGWSRECRCIRMPRVPRVCSVRCVLSRRRTPSRPPICRQGRQADVHTAQGRVGQRSAAQS